MKRFLKCRKNIIEIDHEPPSQVLLHDFAVIQDQLLLTIAVRYEEIHADVHHEVNVDDALESEENSLRGGLEAHAVGREEDLVGNEENSEQDPPDERRIVRMNQWR